MREGATTENSIGLQLLNPSTHLPRRHVLGNKKPCRTHVTLPLGGRSKQPTHIYLYNASCIRVTLFKACTKQPEWLCLAQPIFGPGTISFSGGGSKFWSARQNMHFARLEVRNQSRINSSRAAPRFASTRYFAWTLCPPMWAVRAQSPPLRTMILPLNRLKRAAVHLISRKALASWRKTEKATYKPRTCPRNQKQLYNRQNLPSNRL